MDYEKLYKEALERAKKLKAGFEGYNANVAIIEEIFPELAERTLPTKYKFSSDMNGFAYGTGYEAGKEEVLKDLKESLAFNDIFRAPEWLRELLVTTKENGKKEALNDLPRWKKVDVDTENGISTESKIVPRLYGSGELCFCYKGNYLLLSELEKLPGFKED